MNSIFGKFDQKHSVVEAFVISKDFNMRLAYAIIKGIFLTAALAVFVYQMFQSVQKYRAAPIVKSTQIINLKDMKPPVFYVCQRDQFNSKVAKAHGYSRINLFFDGKLMAPHNGSIPSWKGIKSNKTSNELLKEVFSFNYSTVVIENGVKLHQDPVFKFPLHYCIKLEYDLTTYGRVLTNHMMYFVAVDPLRENHVRIEFPPAARLEIGPVMIGDKLHYQWFRVEISYVLNDASIREGTTCKNYETYDHSYKKCLQDKIESKMLEAYNCIPPWLPTHLRNVTCEIDTAPENKQEKEMHDEIVELLSNGRPKMFSGCLKPCITTDIRFEILDSGTIEMDYALIKFTHNPQVIVLHDMYSYDGFNLLVDLGSSLGLWLGLSAISFLEFSVKIAEIIQKKLNINNNIV